MIVYALLCTWFVILFCVTLLFVCVMCARLPYGPCETPLWTARIFMTYLIRTISIVDNVRFMFYFISGVKRG